MNIYIYLITFLLIIVINGITYLIGYKNGIKDYKEDKINERQ